MTQFTHPKPVAYFPKQACSAKLRQVRGVTIHLHDCILAKDHDEHLHRCNRHAGSTCEWIVE